MEFLRSKNVSLEIYNQIRLLFEWMAVTLEIPEGMLWDNFWHPDIKRAEVNLELLDYIRKTKSASPYQALTQLLKSRNIIGKMVDKNAGLTLMPHDWYHNKLMDHINNANAYSKVTKDPKAKILAELLRINRNFGHKQTSWFNNAKHAEVTPEIYMMSKIQ